MMVSASLNEDKFEPFQSYSGTTGAITGA